jgi:hypothetical protein
MLLRCPYQVDCGTFLQTVTGRTGAICSFRSSKINQVDNSNLILGGPSSPVNLQTNMCNNSMPCVRTTKWG